MGRGGEKPDVKDWGWGWGVPTVVQVQRMAMCGEQGLGFQGRQNLGSPSCHLGHLIVQRVI